MDPEADLRVPEGRSQRLLIQAGLLGAGCVLGLAAAWWVTGIQWGFPGELRKARDLGLVSFTILAAVSGGGDARMAGAAL